MTCFASSGGSPTMGVFMWEGERCRRESWQPVSCRSTNRCTSKMDRWFNRRYVVYIMHVYMDTIMEDIMPVFYDRFVPSRYVVAGCFKCVTKRCAISITDIILISIEKFQLSMSSYVGNIKLCFRKLSTVSVKTQSFAYTRTRRINYTCTRECINL